MHYIGMLSSGIFLIEPYAEGMHAHWKYGKSTSENQ